MPTMTRPYHRRFTKFHARTLAATEALFAARPSTLTVEARHEAFTKWVAEMSDIYRMPAPRLVWNAVADLSGGGFYTAAEHSITMSPNHPSVTTLMHEFRHAMQTIDGIPMVDEDIEVDARAWSLSLYFTVRPALFTRLVREGRILHIDPQDL